MRCTTNTQSRETRRLLAVLVAGLLVSAGGALILQRGERANGVEDNPLALSTAATSTSTSAAPDAVVPTTAAGRVVPPDDPYAAEPILEIGTVDIPKIGLHHRVFHGITLRNIDQGPSHWPGTPMPGESGNTVFAGHRVTHTHPFRDIDKLVAGDEIVFTVNGVRSVYVVTESFVVSPKQVDIADPTPTPMATLFACHPPGSARQRYVVRAALKA